ncbi:MAG TPA: hypothetical protein VIH98_07315 [Xanthobacteraceae bacterium]|jgi:hypothetical protein
MDHLQKFLILLLVAGIPAAAPPFTASAPRLCFTAGAMTYQVAPGLSAADLRVKIVAPLANPDLRIQLITDVQSADFAVVDDFGTGDENACASAGAIKRVRVVADAQPSDITIAISSEPSAGDLKLYVHSARFGHRDAAALFAAVKHDEDKALLNAGEITESW